MEKDKMKQAGIAFKYYSKKGNLLSNVELYEQINK